MRAAPSKNTNTGTSPESYTPKDPLTSSKVAPVTGLNHCDSNQALSSNSPLVKLRFLPSADRDSEHVLFECQRITDVTGSQSHARRQNEVTRLTHRID
ncbi:hypothetical protein NDU88_004083 [Pleurodeles waltl]|uniref:Uncharacterized protein n=1 Tax=Pleurodeles waltl TaxID=8319 RepID=A0AAV7SHR2_PLEWA|nr:hypothetical protein NDU88_004083 [Pleurodeles waltl]